MNTFQSLYWLFYTVLPYLRPSVVYPPEGRLLADSKGVHLFLLMFYPPKGLCKADTEGGPIVFTYVLFWVRKRILDFQFTGGFWHFLNLQNVLFDGTEYQKCPLKIFILCWYIDKVYTYLYM